MLRCHKTTPQSNEYLCQWMSYIINSSVNAFTFRWEMSISRINRIYSYFTYE